MILFASSISSSLAQTFDAPYQIEIPNVVYRYLTSQQYADTVIAFTIRVTCNRKNDIKSISYSGTTPDPLKKIIKNISLTQLGLGISTIKKKFKHTDFWIYFPVMYTHKVEEHQCFGINGTVETLEHFLYDKDEPDEKLPALFVPVVWVSGSVK